MKRLSAHRRKDNFVAEIDAARKRQKILEARKDPFSNYEEEVSRNHYDMVETAPAYVNKLTSRRYRIVQRKCLAREPEYYQRVSVALNAPSYHPPGASSSVAYPTQRPAEFVYADYDDYRPNGYYEAASHPMFDVVPQISLSGRSNRIIIGKNSYTRRPEESTVDRPLNEMASTLEEASSAQQSQPLADGMDEEHVDIFEENYDPIDGNAANELHNGFAPDAEGDRYDCFESEVQEQVEIVDDEINIDSDMLDDESGASHVPLPMATIEVAGRRHYADDHPIDMYKLYDLMAREDQHHSNEELIEYFLSDPAMSHPLNITGLIAAARNSSAELNAQAIAALAMQVNYLKRNVNKMRQDVADLRAACLSQDNQLFSPTGRRFDPSAEVTQDWRIPAVPPLAAVDLVEVAREMVSMRMGKRSARNEDLIRRFVRIVLERLVPRSMVRAFTVRDRERVRGHHPQDIGDFAKDQITGAVLDLMGLHAFDESDSRARAERAYYFQLTNRLMKCAIYDMRRMTPKKGENY